MNSSLRQSISSRAKPRRHAGRTQRDQNFGITVDPNVVNRRAVINMSLREQEEKSEDESEMPIIKTPQVK